MLVAYQLVSHGLALLHLGCCLRMQHPYKPSAAPCLQSTPIFSIVMRCQCTFPIARERSKGLAYACSQQLRFPYSRSANTHFHDPEYGVDGWLPASTAYPKAHGWRGSL